MFFFPLQRALLEDRGTPRIPLGPPPAGEGSPSGGPDPSQGRGVPCKGSGEVTYPSWDSGQRGCPGHAHTCTLTSGDAQLLPPSWGCSLLVPRAGWLLSPPARLGAGASSGEGGSYHRLPVGPVEVTEVLALKGCEHPLTHGASPQGHGHRGLLAERGGERKRAQEWRR